MDEDLPDYNASQHQFVLLLLQQIVWNQDYNPDISHLVWINMISLFPVGVSFGFVFRKTFEKLT